MSATTVFAALHHAGAPLVLPNAWDVASALVLAGAGFPAIATTSAGITAAAGLIDGAGAGRELTVALAATLAQRLAVPLSVDCEGGYSDDPGEVADLAAHLADLGVAGINLEDGLPSGRLRPAGEHAAIIEAVAAAAPALFVNARTDTYWSRADPPDRRLPETLRRLAAYHRAGASGVFVPGLGDLDAIRAVAATIALPLNVLWQPGVDLADLRAAGVARISTGSALYRHAITAALAAATAATTNAAPAVEPITYQQLQHHLRPEADQQPSPGSRRAGS